MFPEPDQDPDPCFFSFFPFPGAATGIPGHGYSPLLVDCGEKVLSTNHLRCKCSPSYCMIGLTWILCMLQKKKRIQQEKGKYEQKQCPAPSAK